MKKYIKLWWTITGRITQVAFASRFGVVFFTIGKLIRFIFFIIFLFILTSQTQSLAGYTQWEVILFFITFNLLDTIAQFLWREVYRFRTYIVSGTFDGILVKPISPLFRSLFGGSDILDLIMLVPLLGFFVFTVIQIGGVSFFEIVLYFVFLINALVILLSFHILVLALGVVTTEVDNAIWMVREVTQLGRIPVSVYPKAVSFAFTFILPVAAMVTIPSTLLLGMFTWQGVIISVVFSSGLFLLSLFVWKNALKHYGSASS